MTYIEKLKKWPLWALMLLALSPFGVGAGVVWSAGTIATLFESDAPSGSNGFACRTNGCRVDLGTGANDYFYSDGAALNTPGTFYAASVISWGNLYAGTVGPVGGTSPLVLTGRVPATAGAGAAVKIGNAAAVNSLDGKIVSFYSDNMTTEKAYVDKDGVFIGPYIAGSRVYIQPAALPTCGAVPEGSIVTVAGSGATPTKVCACLYTPTGAVWAWRNLNANNAGTGIGDTTTCP
jgi:hypothetical protein